MAAAQNLDPKYDSHLDFPTVAPVAQSGHPGHTTKEQDAAVHQLRSMLETGVQGETRHPHSAEILESQEVPGRVEQTDVSYTHSMHAGRQKEMETSSGNVEGDR